MKKLALIFCFVIAATGAIAFNAQAYTIYGYASFSGTLETNGTSFLDASQISTFSNVVVSTAGGEGDYAAILGGQAVTLANPFPFTSLITNLDFWTINVGPTEYSYNVLSSQIDVQNENQLNLQGTGLASITDFEDTPSIWFLSATSGGGRSTFTLSTLVPPDYQSPTDPVPEPATMVLFGVGLLGLTGVVRRKMKK